MPKYMFKKDSPHILNYNPALLSNTDILVLPDDFDVINHSNLIKEYGHRNIYVNDRFMTAVKDGAISTATRKPYKSQADEPAGINKIEKPTEQVTVKATMVDHFENDKLGSSISMPISINNVKSLKMDELRKLAGRMDIKVNSYDSKLSLIRKIEKGMGDSDIPATSE